MKKLIINHYAVFAATIVTQLVRPLWYDYAFFGLRWMELNKLKEEDFAHFNMAIGLGVAFLSGLLATYAMAWLFTKLNVDTGLKGMKYAFAIWICFRLFEVTTQNYFSLRPFDLTIMDETAVLMQYQIIGVLLGIWRKYEKGEDEVTSK
ncbi:MAG TPA: DUF1761 domain-containing protein [Fulvivirga sp.]|nr:DUF1761 domain-containing protein [Fulvivirga sp.]